MNKNEVLGRVLFLLALIVMAVFSVTFSVCCPIEAEKKYEIVSFDDKTLIKITSDYSKSSLENKKMVEFCYKDGEVIKEKTISMDYDNEIIYIPSDRNAIRYTENTGSIFKFNLPATNIVVEYIEK